MRTAVSAISLASALLAAVPAQAWSVSGEAAVVTDYRWRGVSLSGEEPALQGTLRADHAAGLYADVFASTVEGGDGDREAEVDYTLGWAATRFGLDFDASVSAWTYPDTPDANYAQANFWVGRAFGPVSLSLGVEYAPAQDALGDVSDRYVAAAADWTPAGAPEWTFSAQVGRDRGAWAPEGRTDWLVGARRAFGAVAVGLAWTGADGEDVGDTLVASLSRSF